MAKNDKRTILSLTRIALTHLADLEMDPKADSKQAFISIALHDAVSKHCEEREINTTSVLSDKYDLYVHKYTFELQDTEFGKYNVVEIYQDGSVIHAGVKELAFDNVQMWLSWTRDQMANLDVSFDIGVNGDGYTFISYIAGACCTHICEA